MKVSEKYTNLTEFISLLAKANHGAKDEWSRKFVSDVTARWNQHNGDTTLSDKQCAILIDIADGKQRSFVGRASGKTGGMSRRDHFAALAMQATITKQSEIRPTDLTRCVKLADALIAELAKENI